ncbi:hypothetical protein [Sulfurisphaera tokodaii]|uniref:Uncharacterized protein n=1 Tax=Sulfurisphaera tokodaii TaxID=111955 RepID=A0A832TL10_9CREN|nr:hypothetical protein [Sulfurisphaera tokodaii]HII74438.1 hypothetical protein [Sulfurisphaera tokodaii]
MNALKVLLNIIFVLAESLMSKRKIIASLHAVYNLGNAAYDISQKNFYDLAIDAFGTATSLYMLTKD